jgi:hypothetical protein
LSYDGSLLYQLAAHMPLHCIIMVVPPSCPFVALACRCLLRCLCCWHLCSASLFWLIVVFTPLPLPPPAAITKKTFDTNVNVSVSRRLASGHRSNKSGGNAVMLTGGWRN